MVKGSLILPMFQLDVLAHLRNFWKISFLPSEVVKEENLLPFHTMIIIGKERITHLEYSGNTQVILADSHLH